MDIIKSIIEIINSIDKEVRVIAIDGRAGSGKSSLAKELASLLGAGLIHTDDFFLPPELRNEERLSTVGGNMHHERFCSEVLCHIRSKEEFCYNAFDCSKMAIGRAVRVKEGCCRIVEGSYSLHPLLGDYADLRIFMTVDKEEQYRRIVRRNGEERAKIFRSRWIPMEESYFSEYDIPGGCQLIISDNKELTLVK